MRANPDVAYDASPNTGFAVYDSYAYNGTGLGWLAGRRHQRRGPAVGRPARDRRPGPRLERPAGARRARARRRCMTTLYKDANPATSTTSPAGPAPAAPNYSAGAGYDYVTGLGSPDGRPGRPVARRHRRRRRPATTWSIAAPTTDTAGVAFSVTVTAQNASGATDTGYSGTVHFTSTDAPGRPARRTTPSPRPTPGRTPSPSRSRPPAASRSPRPTRRPPPSPAPSRGSPSARPPRASSS